MTTQEANRQMHEHIQWQKTIPLKQWCSGIVVITTAQLHSTKPEIRFCAVSNPARDVSEIRNGENVWQWSELKIKLSAFCRSTIPQRQFIIIIIIIIHHHHLDNIWFLYSKHVYTGSVIKYMQFHKQHTNRNSNSYIRNGLDLGRHKFCLKQLFKWNQLFRKLNFQKSLVAILI